VRTLRAHGRTYPSDRVAALWDDGRTGLGSRLDTVPGRLLRFPVRKYTALFGAVRGVPNDVARVVLLARAVDRRLERGALSSPERVADEARALRAAVDEASRGMDLRLLTAGAGRRAVPQPRADTAAVALVRGARTTSPTPQVDADGRWPTAPRRSRRCCAGPRSPRCSTASTPRSTTGSRAAPDRRLRPAAAAPPGRGTGGGLDELVVPARRDDPPSSSTTMRSASTTVDSRWATDEHRRRRPDGGDRVGERLLVARVEARRRLVEQQDGGRDSRRRAMAEPLPLPPDSRIPSSPTCASSPSRLRSTELAEVDPVEHLQQVGLARVRRAEQQVVAQRAGERRERPARRTPCGAQLLAVEVADVGAPDAHAAARHVVEAARAARGRCDLPAPDGPTSAVRGRPGR
jgi:hypothetical protein